MDLLWNQEGHKHSLSRADAQYIVTIFTGLCCVFLVFSKHHALWKTSRTPLRGSIHPGPHRQPPATLLTAEKCHYRPKMNNRIGHTATIFCALYLINRWRSFNDLNEIFCSVFILFGVLCLWWDGNNVCVKCCLWTMYMGADFSKDHNDFGCINSGVFLVVFSIN